MDQFAARLKFYVDPESPALKDDKNKGKNHYCQGAAARAVTGTVVEKDGKKWVAARRIEPAALKYPERMLAPDKPFVKNDKEPLTLKIDDKLTLKCVYIPPGKFLMGSPPEEVERYEDEAQHEVEITRPFYLGVYPVTQEEYQRVTGHNPSWFWTAGGGEEIGVPTAQQIVQRRDYAPPGQGAEQHAEIGGEHGWKSGGSKAAGGR